MMFQYRIHEHFGDLFRQKSQDNAHTKQICDHITLALVREKVSKFVYVLKFYLIKNIGQLIT